MNASGSGPQNLGVVFTPPTAGLYSFSARLSVVGATGGGGSVKAEICGVKSDICGLGKEGASHAFGIVTAVERNGRSAELATEKTSAATILAIEKTAAAAALAAAVNTAALQKEIAEICCCVREDGEKTRALVSQIDRERLQARLATLEARLPLAATA